MGETSRQLDNDPEATAELPRPRRRLTNLQIKLLIAAAILVVLVVAAVGGTILNAVRSGPDDGPAAAPAPAPTSTAVATPGGISTLSPEEAELVQVTDWQLWRGDNLNALVLDVEAPGLDRPLVRGHLDLTLRLEGRATLSVRPASVSLYQGEPTIAVVPVIIDDDVRVFGLEATFSPTVAFDDVPDYAVGFQDVTFDSDRSVATGTLVAASDDGAPGLAPELVTVTTIVRTPAGAIRNLGVVTTRPPAPGESSEVEMRLMSSYEIRAEDEITHHLVVR